MPKQKYNENFETVESGNWNVAELYSTNKIMSHLRAIDDYILMAKFGFRNLEDEFNSSNEFKSELRIMALMRLRQTIEMLIRNTFFALKKDDKELAITMRKTIKSLENKIPSSYKKISTREGNSFKINENKFSLILNFMEDVSENLLIPLNNADLIFTSIEEWDPDKLKQMAIDELVNEG